MSHVLHVDDNPDLRELTAEFLQRENDQLTVTTAPSGEDALSQINGDIDCIVSDYEMPGMNGLELLNEVRKTHPELPFILFTGKGSEEVASKAISNGVTDYLQKGVGTDQYAVLANRIDNVIARYRAEQEAQRGYEAIEAASDGIALLDTDGDFIYVNETYAELYGYSQEVITENRWEELHPDDEVARFYDEILPQVNSKGSWSGRTTGNRKDGSIITIDHSITLSADNTTICVVRDITEQRNREQMLSVELQFLDDALDALDDIFYVFNTEGELIWWNERMNEVTGYTDDELRLMEPAEFVRPQDRERLNEYIETIQKGGNGEVEVELLTDDGQTIPYEFYSTKLNGETGERIGRVGVGRNITKRKEYQRQLEEMTQRLDEFAKVLSHDLRNPLSIATAHADLIAEHVSDEGSESLEMINDAHSRIKTIISDVLELSRTGELVSEPEPVDLTEIAEQTWADVEHGLAKLSVEEQVTVRADESLLKRLLTNLLRNTVEHGDDDVQMMIGPLESDQGFYVEDDGPGIPAENRENIFTWQYSTKETGHGIGLKSVEQICHAHDWDISFHEGQYGGARFEITGVEIVSV